MHGWYHAGNYVFAALMILALFAWGYGLNWMINGWPLAIALAIPWIFYVVFLPPIVMKYENK